ncbi:putative membrane protein [Aeromicrobium panaciterrae]|uniref:Membrane protein n=1 Tax=Aeromicrobium panaciterrae TaxID=363861 RepID=A0ABU1URF3_9ACTN|nr:hypothetical protein [Aeromicrobium panaciterrae]MDR7087718.1 putative membrane protein [Aeromicrobium panaciterrae]
MKDLRKLVIWLIIGSFSVAALLGIVALLAGGTFGEAEAKVLLTTVIVGVESIAVLCYLSVAGRPTAIVGILGGLVSLVPFGLALWLTWLEGDGLDDEAVWQTFGVGVTIAASIAQACLLLAMAERKKFDWLLVSTLATIVIVAGMISLAIVDGADLGDGFWRTFGVVAILDVLGTVVIAAMKAFGRDQKPEGEPALLTAAIESRIATAAKERGVSPAALITEALDNFLK